MPDTILYQSSWINSYIHLPFFLPTHSESVSVLYLQSTAILERKNSNRTIKELKCLLQANPQLTRLPNNLIPDLSHFFLPTLYAMVSLIPTSLYITFLIFAFLRTASSTRVPKYADSCERAYANCQARFEGDGFKVPTFSIDVPNVIPFTPRIIAKDSKRRLDYIFSFGLFPEFVNANGYTVVTKSAKPPFSPHHFNIYTLGEKSDPAIGHQGFEGNQYKVAKGRCVRVFLENFRLIHGVLQDTKITQRVRDSCVVFRTK